MRNQRASRRLGINSLAQWASGKDCGAAGVGAVGVDVPCIEPSSFFANSSWGASLHGLFQFTRCLSGVAKIVVMEA